MGLITRTIPAPIPGMIPQGIGREGIGREWRVGRPSIVSLDADRHEKRMGRSAAGVGR